MEISEAQRRRPRDLANTREVSAELAEGWKMEGYICLFQIIETKETLFSSNKILPGKAPDRHSTHGIPIRIHNHLQHQSDELVPFKL